MEQPGWLHSRIARSCTWLSKFTSPESGCLVPPSVRSSDSMFHLIRAKIAWPSTFTEHSPMISWLLKRDSVCELWVSLCSSECVGKHVTLKLEFQVIWQNQYIVPVKADLQPQTKPGKQTGLLLCIMTTALVLNFEFSERNMPRVTSHWEGKHPVQLHRIKLTTGMAAKLREHSLLNLRALWTLLMEWCYLSLGSVRQLSNYMDICFC